MSLVVLKATLERWERRYFEAIEQCDEVGERTGWPFYGVEAAETLSKAQGYHAALADILEWITAGTAGSDPATAEYHMEELETLTDDWLKASDSA